MEQSLLLKLLWIPMEATRVNMLRMFLQPPGDAAQQKIPPPAFLRAIAYHAKLTKIIMNHIDDKAETARKEMECLIQIAMNARGVLVEMYGEESQTVTLFQEGLRPAFG